MTTDLVTAAQSGDRVAALTALRDRLAVDIDTCNSGRDVAALSQRLMDVLAQIDDLSPPSAAQTKETGLSDFEKRLRDREQQAKGPRRAKSG